MIARLSTQKKYTAPVFAISELRNESDVEQKLVYPFLTSTNYLAYSFGLGSQQRIHEPDRNR